MNLRKRLKSISTFNALVPKGLEEPLGKHPNDEGGDETIMERVIQESDCFTDADYPSLGYTQEDL